MTIQIDLKKFKKSKLPLMEHLILLQAVYEENWAVVEYMFNELEFTMSDFQMLQTDFPTYLKIQGDTYKDIFIRQEAHDLFNTSNIDIDALAIEMRNLFPNGVKTGGYSVKCHPKVIALKLKKFIKEYPEFNRDTIIEATTKYVEDRRKHNWSYMKTIQYYIYKDNISTLASDCLALSDEEEVENSFETQV